MTGNQDPSFERIHPDDVVDCAAAEAACRRRYTLALALLGTLADSGRTSFADDRRLFMAWQVVQLVAPSWNEPPEWFVRRHGADKRDLDYEGVRADRERDGSWLRRSTGAIRRVNSRAIRGLVVLLDHALQAILLRSLIDVRHRRMKVQYTAFHGWPPGPPADNVQAASAEHADDEYGPDRDIDPGRVVLETAA